MDHDVGDAQPAQLGEQGRRVGMASEETRHPLAVEVTGAVGGTLERVRAVLADAGSTRLRGDVFSATHW